MTLKIGDTSAVHMAYSVSRGESDENSVTTSFAPNPSIKYEVPNCRPKLTEESRSALMTELKARVSSVNSSFKSLQDYLKSRSRKAPVSDGHVRALNECAQISELRDLAQNELAKFSGPNQPVNQVPAGAKK